MSTLIDQAVSAVLAALQSAPAVCLQIGRVNLRPAAQTVSQAVVVRPLSSEVVEASMLSSLPMSWTTAIAVECYARSSGGIGGIAPDQSVDALVEAVYARLMADPTLGGVVLGLQPQTLHYDFDADGERTACATLVFNARHRASPGTLS
jgi:hypothetical protein